MKVLRKVVEIDEELCTGCGKCIPACSEGAIKIIDGKAKLVSERYCDGLGACLGECPEGAIKVVERVAEEFDPEAVEEYLKASQGNSCSTPQSSDTADCGSMLSHWPVQIHLIPPHAPFLEGASLLILADCAAVAYPTLHRDFLKGRVVMMGCPKFDDVEAYKDKFLKIFKKNTINDITLVVMEVPCCSSFAAILLESLGESGIPVEKVTIGLGGNILRREKISGNGKPLSIPR